MLGFGVVTPIFSFLRFPGKPPGYNVSGYPFRKCPRLTSVPNVACHAHIICYGEGGFKAMSVKYDDDLFGYSLALYFVISVTTSIFTLNAIHNVVWCNNCSQYQGEISLRNGVRAAPHKTAFFFFFFFLDCSGKWNLNSSLLWLISSPCSSNTPHHHRHLHPTL